MLKEYQPLIRKSIIGLHITQNILFMIGVYLTMMLPLLLLVVCLFSFVILPWLSMRTWMMDVSLSYGTSDPVWTATGIRLKANPSKNCGVICSGPGSGNGGQSLILTLSFARRHVQVRILLT